MTYTESLSSIGAAADAEVASLTTALVAAKAQHLTDAATIAALEARIAELTAPPVVTPPPATTRPLRYAPPALDNPLTIDLTPSNRRAIIPGDRDAVVRIPAALRDVVGGIEIIGGRNVRCIGGEIGYSTVNPTRALFIKGVASGLTGTVHVEGLAFTGTGIDGDAIDIDCQGQQRTVQLCNIDVSLPLRGSFTGNHSDAVQTWNGPNRLLVDGMVIRNARYQGFFLDPKKFQPGLASAAVELHNVHVIQSDTSGYALYSASVTTRSGSNVRVRTGAVANRVGYAAGAWPFVAAYSGTPDADDKYLSGKPGIGYVSPGYAA